MNRIRFLNAVGAAALLPAASWLLIGCGALEEVNKSLVAGLVLENTPSIDIEKSTNGVDADDAPGPIIGVGAPVVWLYVVTNNGNSSLSNITVTDDQGLSVFCPATTLESGESMNCAALGTATEGQYANVGTATATDPTDNIVTDSDASHYFGGLPASEAAVQIEAATNGDEADDPPGPTLAAGDTVEWTYVVTNIGTPDLVDVAVIDSEGVTVTCPQTALASGESMTCTASGTAIEGQYANVGIVSAADLGGDVVTAVDWSHYFAEGSPIVTGPAIDIEKATNGDDADVAPGPTLVVGDPVEWTYVVANTGDVDLTDVTVVDDQGVAVTCPATELAVGESMTCTAEGVAIEGQYANVGTVTALDPDSNEVTDSDSSHYFGETTAPPPPTGDAGCGLGYWKNHLDAWGPTGYSPDDTVVSVFDSAAAYPGLADVTLAEALRLHGGPTVEDAAGLLLKHAVAALLNAAHPDIDYALTESEVVDMVNANLDSGHRSTILSAKDDIEPHNEMGCHLGWSDDGEEDDDGPGKGHGRGHDDDDDSEDEDEDD